MAFFKPLARFALVAAVAVATATMTAAPTLAGPAEVELLKSYVGTWRGRGELVGAQSETVVCTLDLNPGNAGTVVYRGNCAMAGQKMSVRGTIAYIDAARHFEAAMSTGMTFQPAPAIGQRSGDGILFKMRERGEDDAGNDMTVSADVALQASRININFQVVFNNSGDRLSATVPLTR